jgi:inward rectifier potassium channel
VDRIDEREAVASETSAEEPRDLGFGAVVASESRLRLVNRDGTFNVQRRGLGLRASLSLYYSLLTLTWPRFLGLLALHYLAANALFAAAYYACGAAALVGASPGGAGWRYLEDFFFSVQTLSTIGYGEMVPAGLSANLLVTFESMVGLLFFAVATGLVFARFARPMADIAFSERAVVAPYRGGTGFMFRIANRRRNELVEVSAKVIFARMESRDGRPMRRFDELALERHRVTIFPLSWTIVHPIDESSPLAGMTAADLEAVDGELLVLLTGIDESYFQRVYSRSSYKAGEVVWNARFADILHHPRGGEPVTVDVRRLHDVEELDPGRPGEG